MIGIIGSGFGLYGYLPAALHQEDNVLLVEKARQTFSQRHELRHFADRIIWVDDVEELLRQADTLIISTPPAVQEAYVRRVVGCFKNIKNFILEKPLATDPERSASLLKLLQKHKTNFRINYSFLYTDWFAKLEGMIVSDENNRERFEIDVFWNFKAHHYARDISSWKRSTDAGGGAVNFFGIHLIAVAARLKFNRILSVKTRGVQNDVSGFESVLTRENGDVFRVRVNTDSETSLFKVTLRKPAFADQSVTIYTSESPFEPPLQINELDLRVPVLTRVINDMQSEKTGDDLRTFYEDVNDLWHALNQQATFVYPKQ